MAGRNFLELLRARWAEGKFVCVGLDSELSKIPEAARLDVAIDVGPPVHAMSAFNRRIVEATKDLVCAYKPNSAFYEAHGDAGLKELRRTIEDIQTIAPGVPVIWDAKRADIGNTNGGYVTAAFDFLKADAITVHPYLGREALQPFLDRADKGVIVLCRTSNPGAGEFQDLETTEYDPVCDPDAEHPTEIALYEHVALQISKHWNQNGNCAVVVGATYPEELARVRKHIGDMPILIPGIGAQGGDVEKTVSFGMDSRGEGMIINSSRGIIFASAGADFAEAARRETQKLHDLITQARERRNG